MTHDYVINKLTCELIVETGCPEHISAYRRKIRQALDIGINHFTKDMEEVIMMDRFGKEIERFKGVSDASAKTGVRQSDISSVLIGRQHTAGGFIFRKASTLVLKPVKNGKEKVV